MKRRGFVKLCASAAAAVSANPEVLAQAGDQIKRYERVLLVDQWGRFVPHPVQFKEMTT